MNVSKAFLISLSMIAAFNLFSIDAHAADTAKVKKAKYTEMEFLGLFNGKSRKTVSDKLGPPDRKEVSVKPSSADNFVNAYGKAKSDKPDNVDIWYYDNIVSYAPKKYYKYAELTFVNDRCSNIAFFNTK